VVNRTHLLLKALGTPERLAVLRAVLREGEIKQPDLREHLGMSQPNLSRYLSELAAQGLVERPGSIQAPFRVPRPTETRALLRAAGLIHAAHHGANASDGVDLANEMDRQEPPDG
jgi:DNA-binding transcriptional ArsR family regulator